MDIFKFRNKLISNYSDYVHSFFEIKNAQVRNVVEEQFNKGLLWPEVLIQLNPNFKPGGTTDELENSGLLSSGCSDIFRIRNDDGTPGSPLTFHTHQVEACKSATSGENYVLTTGTGSGKSLCYIVPIVDHVLRTGSGKGIKAIIVYPMNALANSQQGELEKFLDPERTGSPPVTFRRYTGQEGDEDREEILLNPPDILLTNYVMLELILTRPKERKLVEAAHNLRFLVLDELHTYRGRQGADVSLLVRRLKNSINAPNLLCVGTSATMGGSAGENHQEVVSEVASLIFGQEVKPNNVIGETLQPVSDISQPTAEDLAEVLSGGSVPDSRDPNLFVEHPLCRWIEGTFGLREEDGKLVRAQALTIEGESGAADQLSRLTGIDIEVCATAIRKTLLAGYDCKHPKTGRPLFAFRLHQFISRGGSVYSSLESPATRHITLNGQQFVPGDRSRNLFPLLFCRECGEDYHPVARHTDELGTRFEVRDIGEQKFEDEDVDSGFLMVSPENQWPADDVEAQCDYVPDEWIEQHRGSRRIKRDRRQHQPVSYTVDGLGKACEESQGQNVTFLKAPFRFCPGCGVSYDFRQRSDIAKLTSLGTEGRSTATTILSLFTLLGLEEEDVIKKARKLLSFTDNRQDAALQAGHYNDFIEVGLLRSALFRALEAAGHDGLDATNLPPAIFKALGLNFGDYASDPGVLGPAKRRTETALREVISYRIYRDLKRGWRVVMPNLEQAGLLIIDYPDLRELANDNTVWDGHQILSDSTPEVRIDICRTLLDFMRRGLAIKVDALSQEKQEQLESKSFSLLKHPWALGEDERLETAVLLFPRSKTHNDGNENMFLSGMSGYGLYLRRQTTFQNPTITLTKTDTEEVIRKILLALKTYGLVEIIEGEESDAAPGYQIQPEAMIWKAGDGSTPFHDIIRMPGLPEEGGKTNPFFVKFYKLLAKQALGTEALEHTAQVRSKEREVREHRFRRGSLPAGDGEPKGLPILYCSPTMELGIDISELNVVNMRNVPPTPANYAQRSGRAGRSGSPAMVSTYCSTFSSHDQFFFARPQQMVTGKVTAPRIELANEDLIRAHVYAIWLAASGLDLKSRMTEILETDGEDPSLELRQSVEDDLTKPSARAEAKSRAAEVLSTIADDLSKTDWWDNDWIDRTVEAVTEAFKKSCSRWRSLFLAAQSQFDESSRIMRDAARSAQDKKRAASLQTEARNQLALLTQESAGSLSQSDFYTYRYFASEGFLPGYSFPRLPLSAYIPGRRRSKDSHEYVSRARFIAISEFGPRAMIYHAGNKFEITRSLIPLNEDATGGGGLQKQRLKLCPECGFLHTGSVVETLNNCDHCNSSLSTARDNLFRMENVSTTKRKRISSDEEERLKLGFEVISGVRFAERDRHLSFTRGTVVAEDGTELFRLYYGSSATIWRINLGWRRRNQQEPDGFMIDVETGRWQSNKQATDAEAAAEGDATLSRPERVIPYVEDRRNALLIEPLQYTDTPGMASLQAAFKQGIQIEFQLEDMELAAEPLPSEDERHRILLFESSEGGAGVLRRLIIEEDAISRVAKQAIEICHYDPKGNDLRRGPGSNEDCEAACYQCLLSYSNQRDHKNIFRDQIKDTLFQLANAKTRTSGGAKSRGDHFNDLRTLCESDLEREWMDALESKSLRLPSHAQHFLADFSTRPDFFYSDHSVAIYVDGHHHDYPDRAARDRDQEDALEAGGIRVIRFRYDEDWDTVFGRYQFLFGQGD